MPCRWDESFAIMDSMAKYQHVEGSASVPNEVFKSLQWFFPPFRYTEEVAKFVLDGINLDDPVLIDFGRDLVRHDVAQMPATLCYFESYNPDSGDTIATFALDTAEYVKNISDDDLRKLDEKAADEVVESVNSVSRDRPVWMATLELRANGGCALFGPGVAYLKSEAAEADVARTEHALVAIDMIMAPLSVLAMKTTTRHVIEPSKRINKKRVERGDAPLPTYEIIKLSYEQVEHERSERGMRASPRPHFRRGHIRHLQDGRRVPVAPTYVIGEAPIKIYRK